MCIAGKVEGVASGSAPWPGGRCRRSEKYLKLGLVEEVFELLGAAGVAKLAQRLRLDLADALASDAELAPDFFQRPAAAVVETEAHCQHRALAVRERQQDIVD